MLKNLKKMLTTILILLFIFVIFAYLYSIHRYLKYQKFEELELRTDKEINLVLENYNISLTDNIKPFKLGYDPSKKEICLLLKDISNIRELYFSNFAYYECTEEQFKSMFAVPFENFGMVDGSFVVSQFQGTINTLEKGNDKIIISLYRTEIGLYCEVRKQNDAKNIFYTIHEMQNNS